MRFDRREFQYLFDTQIAEMCRLIDSQLTQLQQANSNYQIVSHSSDCPELELTKSEPSYPIWRPREISLCHVATQGAV